MTMRLNYNNLFDVVSNRSTSAKEKSNDTRGGSCWSRRIHPMPWLAQSGWSNVGRSKTRISPQSATPTGALTGVMIEGTSTGETATTIIITPIVTTITTSQPRPIAGLVNRGFNRLIPVRPVMNSNTLTTPRWLSRELKSLIPWNATKDGFNPQNCSTRIIRSNGVSSMKAWDITPTNAVSWGIRSRTWFVCKGHFGEVTAKTNRVGSEKDISGSV